MALGSRFGEQVCRIAALGQQLWRTALGHNFGEQRRGTALGSSFEEQLWRLALGDRFEACRGALENSFGEPLWGAALASCPEQLSGRIALKNSSFRGQFYKQLRGAAFSSNVREQLWSKALGSHLVV